MKQSEEFSWKKRRDSFKYAINGIRILMRDEHNARIHLLFTSLALIASALLHISVVEWCLVILCIGLVFAAECINSAIEALADRITTENDPYIKKAKDVAAAAVLFLAIAAALTGFAIFLPKIIALCID